MSKKHSVDLLYLAWNRLAFTRESFTTLLRNTEWDYVRRLWIYDDGSGDGTYEWLQAQQPSLPVPARLARHRFRSPVAAMNHFITASEAPLLAKVDNDVMMPPGWLGQSLAVMARHPELDMLGLEAHYPCDPNPQVARSYAPADFISGLGLYRRRAFTGDLPRPDGRWFGFETWQAAQGDRLVQGWIRPALPIFLLDRLPFNPWQQYTAQYVRAGWQRAWPAYPANARLWQWRWREAEIAEKARVVAEARPRSDRFLCALRIKNEARYIRETLTRALALCSHAFVFDDHSTDDTVEICRSFGERVTLFPSPFSGLDEARDKNYLLEAIKVAQPEWVLWIDGDEVLEKKGPARIRQAARRARNVASFQLRIAYLWDDPRQVRVDGIFGRFWRPSLFRLRGQPLARLHFPQAEEGVNFHCGNVPRGLQGRVGSLDVRLKHYGYMERTWRQAKYEWYRQNDPNNASEDNYRHLAEIPGARFAPGPPRLVPWEE